MEEDYLVARYFGNTSAAIALYYNPPGCMRVLDPEIDSLDLTIPVTMREAARLTDLNRIINAHRRSCRMALSKRMLEQDGAIIMKRLPWQPKTVIGLK